MLKRRAKMAYIEEKKAELNGLTLHTVQTKKFKTNTLILKLKAPLTEEDVTHRAILPYVLQRGTESFPTSSQLRKYLDDLYGAFLHVELSKKGEHHIISIRLDIPNEKFLHDQMPLLEKGIKLLAEILLKPHMDKGQFVQDIVEQEKRTLKQRIQAVFDDKMRYANLRLVQEMCQNEPYRLHVNGELEDIPSISAKSLTDYYQKVLRQDDIDLYIVGDVSHTTIQQYVNKHFTQLVERKGYEEVITKQFSRQDVKEVIEEQDVKQGKLNIGYRTNTFYQDDDYYVLQVFNGIFGGFSHSKLFINVREKESLAYYAASRVESHKGLLFVMSGIEVSNYEKTLAIIQEQMEAMRNGEFTEKELGQTKAIIQNQLLETIDTAYGMVEVLYNNVLAKKERTVEEWIKGIHEVTKKDVVAFANKMKLDTIYFLKGYGGNRE